MPSFISKIEVKGIPIIGMITRLLGSVFVDRSIKDKSDIVKKMINKIHK